VGNYTRLLAEAESLIERSRNALAEMPEQIKQDKPTKKKDKPMSSNSSVEVEVTAEAAGKLYAEGMSVIEVARATNVTYSKARKLIAASGTQVRDSSARLKGRTRKTKIEIEA
jgi:hypothetical protein